MIVKEREQRDKLFTCISSSLYFVIADGAARS